MKIEKTDVLIVGAGPSGISAALALKQRGIGNITIMDREPEAGGIPRLCHHVGFGIRDMHRVYSGPAYARRYARQAVENGITIRTSTTITGWHDDNTLTYSSRDGLGMIEARAILLATGCRERPRAARLVPGRRLQGIFTTGSLQRFVDERKLPVGNRSLIVGAELVSLSAFSTLTQAGVDVAMMVTELPQSQIYFPFTPMKWMLMDVYKRTPVRTSTHVSKILGSKRVEGVELTDMTTGKVERVACDSIVFTGDWIPENEVARNGRLSINTNTNGPQTDAHFRTSKRGVFAAGNLLRGVETADVAALEGRSAAGVMYEFLENGRWPEKSVAIEVEPPIAWVMPNVVVENGRLSPKRLSFRVNEFHKNASIQVYQGKNQLHTQTFRRLSPNKSLHLSGEWMTKVDLNNGVVKIVLKQ